MIQTVEKCIEDVVGERSLDRRLCYIGVTPADPDGNTVVCECSDATVLQAIRDTVMRVTGSDKRVRYVALPSDATTLPDGLVASVSVANIRRSAGHASELVTQIVYGDPAEPLKKEGDWYLVRLDDGYIGWIRNWHTAELSKEKQRSYKERARYRVAENVTTVFERPGRSALPVTDLVVGTPVDVRECGERGWRSVVLADGKRGYIAAGSIEKPRIGKPVSRDSLVATGLRFLGIPYLWGGTTPKGFDCSGLIQRVFRLHGLLLPRDTDQQARAGREKPTGAFDGLAPGDLVFFGKPGARITHAGLHVAEGLFIHASGRVRTGSLDPASERYEPGLAADWQFSRDVITG